MSDPATAYPDDPPYVLPTERQWLDGISAGGLYHHPDEDRGLPDRTLARLVDLARRGVTDAPVEPEPDLIARLY
jgi:hypothetical protein